MTLMIKFIVLNFTQYSRVLFLDADVLPLHSLDYLFEISEAEILKPNVILAAGRAPQLVLFSYYSQVTGTTTICSKWCEGYYKRH